MNRNILKGCLASVLFATSTLASAGMIEVTESISIAEKGERNVEQDHFEWSFTGLSSSIEEITLTFDWERMDFFDVNKEKDGEYLEIFAIGSEEIIGTIGEEGEYQSTKCVTTDGPTIYDDETGTEKTLSDWYSDCDGSSKEFTLSNKELWSTGTLTIINKTFTESDVGSQGYFEEMGVVPGFVNATINYSYEEETSSQEVPEPSSFAILALGLLGLASRRLKKHS